MLSADRRHAASCSESAAAQGMRTRKNRNHPEPGQPEVMPQSARAARASCLAAQLTMAVGAMVLLGWSFGIEVLTCIVPNSVAMNPLTALTFIAAGLSLLLLHREGGTSVLQKRLGRGGAALVFAIGLAKIVTLFFGWNFAIDQWFFHSALIAGAAHLPNRMAPNTALNFVLAGLALLCIDVQTKRGNRITEFLCITSGLSALFALVGYAYDVDRFYTVGILIPMALPTAATFFVLCTGILLARANRGITAIVASPTAGGFLARRLLPVGVVLPLAIGALRLQGERQGYFAAAFGVAFFAISLVLAFLGAIWWTARLLFRIDSERQTLEAIRHEHEERFGQLAGHIDDVFWISSLKRRKILYVSPGYEKIWGRRAKALYENPNDWAEALHPDDRERVTELIREHAGEGSYEHEYRIVRDGEIRYIRDRAYPVRDQNGQVYRVAGIASDVTEQKEAREELDRFFTVSHDLLTTTGFDGRFKRLNPAWEKTLGWTAKEMENKPFLDFVHPEDREATISEAAALQTGRDTISFENRYRCKDGRYRWLLWSAAADLARQTVFSTARDITNRKEIESALQHAKTEAEMANHAKSEFLSRMSHELRTPLNAILGFGQLLEMDKLTDDQQESASHIVSAGRHLLDLINEVLEISRIESGGMTLSLEPVLLPDLLRQTLTLVGPLASERGISLVNLVGENAGLFIRGDRQRLKQVLLNLLSNAIKYNRAGGEVRIEAQTGRTQRLRLDIIDTGIGIRPENLKRLFIPFDRLGAEATSVEGTGLGLALSRRFMELMGGTIDVRTEAGVGSTFSLELETAPDPETAAVQAETMVDAPARPPREMSIVYIEDNLSNFKVVERVLSRRPGVQLRKAMEGQRGLELARECKPDVVLLDLHLPDMDGSEVLRRLRSDPRTDAVPVIIISADATPRQIERLREAGAQAYLTKPFNVQEFMDTLDQTLDRNVTLSARTA
jgi:PAS domain S-box-containing protein